MITEITAQDFKGLTFSQKIGRRTLFLGPNGAGKTARSQALTLALLRYIPGAEKTNEAILRNFGTKDVLVVGFKTDKGFHFEVAFGKTPKGAISQAYKVNGKKCSKEFFITSMAEAGTPKILDLATFLDLSDQKRIDYLLDLYPPAENIKGLTEMIDTQKRNYLQLEEKARASEASVSTMTASRAAMQLPPGNLAETAAEIQTVEKQIEEASKDLQAAKTKIAEEKAREDQKKKDEEEAERQKKKSDEELKRKEEELKRKEEELEQKRKAEEAAKAKAPEPPPPPSPQQANFPAGTFTQINAGSAIESINAILQTMSGAGCVACAATLVCKRELNKYRKEA